MGPPAEDSLEGLAAADLMTQEVLSVEPSTMLLEAIRTMVQRRIRHLPVVKRGKVVAVLSDRDVRLMVTDLVDPAERQRYLATTSVMQHASSPVTTGTPDMPARDVARIFVESRIGCLPIVDAADQLVGILTQTDMLSWLARLTD